MRPHQTENGDLSPLGSSVGNKTKGGEVLNCRKRLTGAFEQIISRKSYMDAAYNLARLLTRNEHHAEDRVQKAYLREFKLLDGFHGTDASAGLLTIVRNTCYTWLQQKRAHEITTMFDEEIHSAANDTSNPATLALQSADHQIFRQALDELPVEFREVVVLRDLEDFSYKEIAEIANIPRGTVMSRLARARERLKQLLCKYGNLS